MALNKKKKMGSGKPNSHDAQLVIIHQYPQFFQWIGTAGVAISSNRYLIWFMLLLLFVLTLFQNPQSSGGDYDFFFHLKYGEIYLKNLNWKLDHSQFSWTPASADWPYVTWIGNILIYLFYNIANGNGVLIFQWLVYAGSFLLALNYLHKAGDRLDPIYLLFTLLAITAISVVDLFIKPDLLTTLFFTGTVFIYFYVKTTSRNIFYLYPPLFLLWVNTHGGFVNGFIFILLALLGELVNLIFFKGAALNKRLIISLLAAVLISALATLINPYGYHYHIHLYENLFSREAYESFAKPLFAYRNLWGHIFTTGAFKFTNAAWSILFMACVLVGLFLYAAVKRRFIDVSLVLTGGAFFAFSMQMARAAKFFPILCFFMIIYLMKIVEVQDVKRKLGAFALIIFFLAAGRITYQTFVYASELPTWDYSKLINNTPQDVVRFLTDNKLPGPIFNDYLIGGYLMWSLYPEYKVFIDPRQGPYAGQVWGDFQKYANTTPFTAEKLAAFTKKYPFKIAVVHYAYFKTIDWFLSSPEWKLIYFDRVAAVIIHKSVVPTLTKQALGTEAGTIRFVNVKDAQILKNLFIFYIHVGPTYARDIVEIYRKQVNDLYFRKLQDIQEMEQDLQQKIMQVQQPVK